MKGKYDDILHLPHHVSPTRRRMTMAERAAQFSPFAALVGYEEEIRETGRLTGQQVELSEEEKAILDQKQQIILAALEQGERPEITVVYFQRDKKKAGGEYTDFTGLVKQGKEVENVLLFTDGTEIPFSDIIEINSEWLEGYFDP